MSYQVLTEAQVAQFELEGFVKLEQAFAASDALACQEFLWERLAQDGIIKGDSSTWTRSMVQLNENYDTPAFRKCLTPRLVGAVEDLVGTDRWSQKNEAVGWGWWPVNFAKGADRPWTVPTEGWHWDGINYRHKVDSPNQGLLLLAIFSEIGAHGGGTLIAAGSHRIVARFLAQHPEGMEIGDAIHACQANHPWLKELTGGTSDVPDRVAYFMEQEHFDEKGLPLRVYEATASPGDIYLCHPFLYHAASQNHSDVPRFMCNQKTPLIEPLNIQEITSDTSPLEVSIVHALK